MKRLLPGAAMVCVCALAGCEMLGLQDGPAPGSPAARAAAALPPPAQPAPLPQIAAPSPEAEDLTPLPADQVKCIPPFVLRTTQKDGQTEARCVAPSEVSGAPK